MKIIYFDSGRIPTEKAHGLQIMKMCEAMAGLGHEVILLTGSRRNNIKDDPFSYYGIEKNFEFRRLPSVDLVNLWPKFGTWLTRVSFLLCAKIYLLFQKYDLLYLREHMSGLFFRDFVLETHTLPQKIRPADLRVWRRARLIVVTTSFIKKRLIAAGVGENKIIVAPDGVGIEKFKVKSERFKVREELGLPQDAKIVMYTGHLYEWKGASTLLDTARNFQFPISNPQVLFVFVGGTVEDIKKFREMADDAENVLILGHKLHTVIPKYLAAADILVLPNSGKFDISKFYTSPLKLFEYMAAGRPIVASDLPSIREILNEKNAMLVKPDDPEDLARGIEQALKNQELSGKIAAQSYLDVKQYTWQIRAKNILATFSQTAPT